MPLATALSIFSLGILACLAFSIIVRRVGELVSPFASLLSIAIRLANLPHTLLFCASAAPFCRLIFDHLLCPLIGLFYERRRASATRKNLSRCRAEELESHLAYRKKLCTG